MRFLLSVLLFGLLSLTANADSLALPSDHEPLAKECFACHQDEEHRKAVIDTLLVSDKCTSCHEAGRIKAGLIKTAQATKPDASSSASPKTIKTPEQQQQAIKKAEMIRGMRFPMYYQGTRVGDASGEMVLIPAGPFIMGTNERLPDEGPQHVVDLPDYYIDIHEVTNLQYKKFNDETRRRSPIHFRNRTFPPGKADHPVTFVTWIDADAYCQWAGKRLPTDQEWEKAARGTKGQWFPWGDEFDSNKANTPLRWQEIGNHGDTTPVGAFEKGKSPFGLYDTSGNVWEWTASWYKAYPDNKTDSESYGERYKTLKGGSWFDCSFYKCGISAPVFNRAFFAKKVKNDSFGFRCAQDAGLYDRRFLKDAEKTKKD